MKANHRIVPRALLLLALAAGAGALEGQSAFAIRGLGLPIEPQDARARALGGVTLGFPEGELSWSNPAGMAGLVAPGMVVSYQYDSFGPAGEGARQGSTARVPLLLAAFPAGGTRFSVQAGFGGFLDQNWRLERPDTLVLGLDTVLVTDIVSSEGGATRLRLGGAVTLGEGLGVGVGVEGYAGGVDRVQGRIFPGAAEPECCRAAWSYGGLGLVAGVQWAPTEATGLGVSVSYGGTLEATPRDTIGQPRSYSIPTVVRVGGTARLAENALLGLATTWSGWSALDDELRTEGGARDSWSLHSGLEWDGITVRERPVPVRLGARAARLPFGWGAGGEGAQERAVSAGLGTLFAGGALRSDLSLELGDRSGEGFGADESFWRFGFSVRVLGW
jgi:hypothetical protein